jgi:Bacterial protein of unknown function (DUF937)
MTGILDSLKTMITPDVSDRMARSFGIEPTLLQKAMSIVGPTALAGLARRASTPGRAEEFIKNLPQDSSPDFFKSLLGGIGAAGLTTALLGSGANAIGASLSQKMGFNIRPLLTLAIPMVGGIVAKLLREQKLSPAGLSSLLQKESSDYLNNPSNAETAKIVRTAFEAGERAEALRNRFQDAEWSKVRRAPVAAMFLVASASPSGLTGLFKEFSTAEDTIAQAGEGAEPTSLVTSAFGGGIVKEDLEAFQREKPDTERLLAEIHDAYVVVSSKGAPEAAGFRDLVVKVAQRTAEASKEGGFFGLGGTKVSAEEQRALERIQSALN